MESGLLNWLSDDVESLSPSTFIEELEDNKKYSFSKNDFTQSEVCMSDDSLKSITSFAIISESNTDEEKNDIITTKKKNELDDTSLITNESYTGKSDELSILKYYIDAVDEAKHKISEIELVWPEFKQKYLFDNYDIPDSYVSNTNIEKVVLLYADNFIKQLETKYPYRRQLLLVHENECGYQKCICTTIKPSILPYSDLCDLKSCSQFIANYMTYVPLSNPILVPKQVKSPALVLKNQTANCFELAILLVSFLIGRGYNAFVVQGYATEETCNNDFKNITLDLPSDEDQSEENTILDEMDDEYSIDPPIDLCTDFVKTLMKDDDDNKDVDLLEIYEEDNKFVYDPLHRQRVHCWVIILPLKIQNKYINKELFFVEPSTGKICSISSRSYIGIEALWNNQNYWVNLQPLYGGCMQYNYTLMNTKCWEHFLIDEPKHLRRELNKVDSTIKVNKHLFMPNSWVTVLKIPRNMYLMIYPSGKKIIMYSNAVKELYADYIMPDGLVERITYYKKKDRIQKMFVKELYKHRADLLMRIDITYTDKGNEIVEYFRSGRKDCLKTHKFNSSKNNIEDKRFLSFYDTTILDSLIELKMDKLLVIAKFKERTNFSKSESLNLWRFCVITLELLENSRSTRALDGRGVLNSKNTFNIAGYNSNTVKSFDWNFKNNSNSSIRELEVVFFSTDRLFWRMYEFNFDKSIEEKSISEKRKIKIIYEKYLRNKTLPNYRDIAVREFNLAMNSIHVEYHFGEGQITRPGRLFHKPLVSGKDIQFDEDLVIESEVYPYENKLKPFEAYLMLKDMMEAEYEARRDLSRLETNVSSILKTRISECLKFQLIVESLDWDRNTKNKQLLQNEKDKVRAFKKREKAKQIEYALPYLEVATKPLTEQSAKIIRDKIISDFRQSTKYQFVKARNSLIKKQFALKSMMNSLESDVFENIEQKKKMTTLCSTLKSKLDMLLLKMERFKEKQIEKYNNLALYLNSLSDFKMLPKLNIYEENKSH